MVERFFIIDLFLAFLQAFSTTSPLRSTKKTLVEQAREFSKRTDTKVQRAYQSDSDSDSDDERKPRTKRVSYQKYYNSEN